METLATLQTATLKLINAHRAKNKLAPLVPVEQMNEIATTHSKNMASGKVGIGHDDFQKRAAQVMTLLDAITVAENVAYGQESPEEVLQNWLDSAGHRQNIEGPYSHTGLAIVQDENGRNVFTQIFAAVEAGANTDNIEITDDYLAVELLHLVNDYRQDNNLALMESDMRIVKVAEKHSQRMASGAITLGYDGLKEDLMELAKALQVKSIAANIAQSRPNAEKIIDTWLNSPAHSKHIEGQFTKTGLGVAHNDKGDYFITQLFILD